jgi:hypothetical protein
LLLLVKSSLEPSSSNCPHATHTHTHTHHPKR